MGISLNYLNIINKFKVILNNTGKKNSLEYLFTITNKLFRINLYILDVNYISYERYN